MEVWNENIVIVLNQYRCLIKTHIRVIFGHEKREYKLGVNVFCVNYVAFIHDSFFHKLYIL
jgi:hypothetical protein